MTTLDVILQILFFKEINVRKDTTINSVILTLYDEAINRKHRLNVMNYFFVVWSVKYICVIKNAQVTDLLNNKWILIYKLKVT